MMFLVVDSFSVDYQLNRRTRYRNDTFNERVESTLERCFNGTATFRIIIFEQRTLRSNIAIAKLIATPWNIHSHIIGINNAG
jgi:hypothetical protein